jgi:hypothetical protein
MYRQHIEDLCSLKKIENERGKVKCRVMIAEHSHHAEKQRIVAG